MLPSSLTQSILGVLPCLCHAYDLFWRNKVAILSALIFSHRHFYCFHLNSILDVIMLLFGSGGIFPGRFQPNSITIEPVDYISILMCWQCFEHTTNHANEIECGLCTVYHTSIIRIDRIEKVIRLKSFISRNFNTRLLVLSTQNHIGNCYCNMQLQSYAKFGTGVDAFFPFFIQI